MYSVKQFAVVVAGDGACDGGGDADDNDDDTGDGAAAVACCCWWTRAKASSKYISSIRVCIKNVLINRLIFKSTYTKKLLCNVWHVLIHMSTWAGRIDN